MVTDGKDWHGLQTTNLEDFGKLLNMRKPPRNSLNLRKKIKSIKFMQCQNFQNRQSSKDVFF